MQINIDNTQSIQQAISSVCGDEQLTLHLAKGTYNQKVIIDRPNTTIIGQGRETVICFDDCANKIHADGKEYNTFRTFTVNVIAPNVTLSNLSIVNSTTNPKQNGQAVALSVYADRVQVSECFLCSTQDTLFCGPLPPDLIERYVGFLPDNQREYSGQARHLFYKCQIKGSVDFIFGCGDSLFYDCDIISINDGRGKGFVCAPAHTVEQTQGFLFYLCRFDSQDLAPNTIYLARPWRDFGLCAFICCQTADHICPDAFDKWNDTNRDKTARFFHCDCGIDNAVAWSKHIDQGQKKRYMQFVKDRLNLFSRTV